MIFSPQYSGENAHRLLKNTKAPLKGFKSGARSLGVSSGKITLFKAAIIVHNNSSKRKEERAEILPNDSNKNTTYLPVHNFLQPIRELKPQ